MRAAIRSAILGGIVRKSPSNAQTFICICRTSRFRFPVAASDPSLVRSRERLEAAAKEFEAMLIQQLLKTARQAGSPYESEDAMTGGEGYLEIAEQQLARVLAEKGTFGFARLLVKNVSGETLAAKPRTVNREPTW